MSWSNYHGHCYYCDGKEVPEAYVKEALKQQMRVIGFSCHAPLPFETGWTMPADKLDDYLTEIDQVTRNAPQGLTVLKSLEVDFIPGIMGPNHPDIQALGLDYVVGSVHYVDRLPNGNHWSIDNSNSEFAEGIQEIFKGDVQLAIQRYFELQRQMLMEGSPDILGHCDKIRMHNLVHPHFSETDEWYIREVHDLLKLAAEKQVVVEINTKYFTRKGIFFPSQDHFKYMFDNGVRVTINSDAHRPEALLSGFAEVAELLLKAGFTHLWEWDGDQFSPHSFSEEGINWS
ncbi:histidinol-phosphatase [Geofilum rubicundum]|uniref:Histidinol-phosphatase n=1 Tax=Geofilum rubicundum JCM 15548 TaxID=1236989 RepID=A0A0E9LXH8_9BACT|nr:histidinol-phosphatase [Geofilum rubicundum]GAO30287.1 histidinol-phosphatase [Geofilum rubicundum JCM 15548]